MLRRRAALGLASSPCIATSNLGLGELERRRNVL